VSAGLSHVLGSGVVGWQEDILLTNPFFHDIRPVKGGQEGSNGGGEPLNFHQDMSYEFERAPEFLTLACLREGHDKNVRTPIVPNRQLYEMVQQYHPEDMKVLKDYNSYRVKLPPSMGGAYADPMPLLTGDSPESATFWLRVNYDRIESMTEEAAAAFKRLQKAMDQLENDEVHLVDGDLLLIGNKKCLHRRTDFTAQFDGDDRLLVRNYSKLLDHTIVPTHRFMDLAPAE
jgi:L-asparagine oxygenase